MTSKALKAKPLPFVEPPAVEVEDVYAIKALWAGVASASQQKRAMKWILEAAGKIDADPFRADARLTEHLVGRQSVARMILSLVNTTIPES